MNSKEAYLSYCQTHEVSLFMQPWWLDAVCVEGKEWRVLLSKENGNIVGALPYLYRKKYGVKQGMPLQFTQLINAEYANDLPSLIDDERLTFFFQHISYDESMAELLKRNGFVVKNRFTYRITDLSDMDAVYARFSLNKKRQIEKAKKLDLRLDTLSATEMYDFHKQCLKKRGSEIFYSRTLFCALCEAAVAHGQGRVLAARSFQGDLLAAVFLVWDEQFCYYLVPTFDPDFAKTGASAWLTFEAIKFAQSHSQIFDFEGSMIGRIAKNYRQFGSEQYNYCKIEKCYNPLFGFLWKMYKRWQRK